MSTLGKADRQSLLLARAEEFAKVILGNLRREFPNHIRHVMSAPGDMPNRPKDVFPAFYGCFDWHSCVEMHWAVARLLRTAPEQVPVDEIRAVLDEHLTADNIAVETRSFHEFDQHARPYAWGWELRLQHELSTWDDPDAQRWAANLAPLTEVITAAFTGWLPKATYPDRQGMHFNSAFGLSLALPHAHALNDRGEPTLVQAIAEAAHRWFDGDVDYPARLEPGGADFLSPALCEAELMSNLFGPAEFVQWFDRFLPDISNSGLFTPAVVSDDSDGQIAHLHGLNLSRAWCLLRLAAAIPPGDVRIPAMRAAAAAHARPELDLTSGTDYMVEHWLACYAVLLLT
ncbi:DUF2891 domain-containing protein [Kutzneria chonburiensis]|uniref:DUF2891 domain-containing protein n=1 Tax=Kutzneria chonburiensis TaxID=1483604 RepID=A0ABV6N502_9PSEU|nr:DUF2891 domain-containing protein [Kutzneria chonburiensis]